MILEGTTDDVLRITIVEDCLLSEDFQQRVRQYRPSDLLPAIGATSIEFFESETWQKDRVRLPWALAEIAKTSIASGNEYRSAKVEARDVFQLCSEYNALDDPLRQRAAGLSGTPAAFMVRMQYLQFPYQDSPFEEVARITALFEDVDSLDTKIVSSAFLSHAIGCTLHDYVNAGIAICSVAQNRGGHFDPTWPALSEWSRFNQSSILYGNRDTSFP